MGSFGVSSVKKVGELALLLFSLMTLLFFLMRLAGDPAMILAGADATEAQLVAIRREYGFDQPLFVQYLRYLGSLAAFDFGTSIASGRSAFLVTMEALPVTLQLTLLAMGFTVLVCLPLGVWLGSRPAATSRRLAALGVFIAQGTPGFVAGLFFIQFFSVEMGWLPSIGRGGLETWILPVLTLASFLVPKLVRVVASNVTETLSEDYVRTALAYGASRQEVLWRHAIPNALLGSVALLGAQFAYLVSGSVIVETMFAWPGLGWQLMQSTLTLDYPMVQALTIVIAVLVFAVNAMTDLAFKVLDPRLRDGSK